MCPDSVRFVDLTFPDPADNLGHDDSLLAAVEAELHHAVLRIWEPGTTAVIVGRSNDIGREVNLPACEADNVPILRRNSGGGAVVFGPGCLCFTLVLPIPDEFSNLGISGVTRAVMLRLANALSSPSQPVFARGVSDLVLGDRKFSGNSQRWKKRSFLHHGTILYNYDLSSISRYLNHPSREPDYRHGRTHAEFVTNLSLTRAEIIRRLCESWRVSAAPPR